MHLRLHQSQTDHAILDHAAVAATEWMPAESVHTTESARLTSHIASYINTRRALSSYQDTIRIPTLSQLN